MLMLKSITTSYLGSCNESEAVPQQKRSVSVLSFIIRESRKILHHKLVFRCYDYK